MKMYYRNLIIIPILLFYACFSLSGCGSGESVSGSSNNSGGTTGKYAVDKTMQGLWYVLDTDTRLNIGKTTDYVLELEQPDCLKITEEQLNFYGNPIYKTYHAIRYGDQTNQVTVKVNTIGGELTKSGMSKAIGLGGLGGINVIITNIHNSDDRQEGVTDINGNAGIPGVTSGDHTITVDDGSISTDVDIFVDDDTNAGVITPVSSGYSFKLSNYTNENKNHVYGDDRDYTLQFKVKNVGDANALGMNYSLSTDDPLLQITSGTGPLLLGTVNAGAESTINLTVHAAKFSDAGYGDQVYHDVKFNITLTDVYGVKWYDYIIVRVFHRRAYIKVNTTLTERYKMRGFIIFPDHTLLRITNDAAYTTLGEKVVTVPFRPDASYCIMLGYTADGGEYVYSIGVDSPVQQDADFASFGDTSAYEPNNSEADAASISTGQTITAYIHQGDLDYYRVTMTGNLDVPAVSVTAGVNFSTLLRNDSTLWASGESKFMGIDSDGSKRLWLEPVMTGVSQVYASFWHTMILKSDGSLYGAGDNNEGELGIGVFPTGGQVLVSKPVFVMSNVLTASTGCSYTMIVTGDGKLYATGKNDTGQLGLNNTTRQSSPVWVMDNVANVYAGYTHTLIITTGGQLYATGKNQFGQFGNGTTNNSLVPVSITGNIKSAAVGSRHSVILGTDGRMYTMGYNGNGQLGDGTTTNRTAPTLICNDVKSVFAGGESTMYIKNNDTLWAMGWNSCGQLGTGDTANKPTPVQIMSGVASVSMTTGYTGNGTYHTIILKTDGTVWGTGSGAYGQLFDGTATDKKTSPVRAIQ